VPSIRKTTSVSLPIPGSCRPFPDKTFDFVVCSHLLEISLPQGWLGRARANHRAVLAEQSQRFWTEFIDGYLKLDDPEQPKPRPARLGYISLSLPAPVSWLTVYRGFRPDRVGIFLSCHRNTAGAYARQAIIDEWKAGGAVKDELGGTVRLDKTTLGSVDTIID
jgi:hypothetical protein